jgi:cupin fold WbuC family metalloprotein
MIKIDNNFADTISAKAQSSPRLRMNYNYHPQLDDLLQRMLNAMEPGTYIQPHKHQDPDKTEVFFCLRGRIAVVEFDDEGEIKDYFVLDTKSGNYASEIPPRTWHTVISLESGSVAYEFKNGPYCPIDDKNFASWAPVEGSPDCAHYLKTILGKLHLA